MLVPGSSHPGPAVDSQERCGASLYYSIAIVHRHLRLQQRVDNLLRCVAFSTHHLAHSSPNAQNTNTKPGLVCAGKVKVDQIMAEEKVHVSRILKAKSSRRLPVACIMIPAQGEVRVSILRNIGDRRRNPGRSAEGWRVILLAPWLRLEPQYRQPDALQHPAQIERSIWQKRPKEGL